MSGYGGTGAVPEVVGEEPPVLRFRSCECEHSEHPANRLRSQRPWWVSWTGPDVPARCGSPLRLAVDAGHIYGAVVQTTPPAGSTSGIDVGAGLVSVMTAFGRFELCGACRAAQHMAGGQRW